mmetsp:Transcript_9062/g.37379  ORF Transcript_9062/g.37379 Transcript_9062/m.37379 type:complete len:231 (-) Transcript_9062:165-857(-)
MALQRAWQVREQRLRNLLHVLPPANVRVRSELLQVPLQLKLPGLDEHGVVLVEEVLRREFRERWHINALLLLELLDERLVEGEELAVALGEAELVRSDIYLHDVRCVGLSVAAGERNGVNNDDTEAFGQLHGRRRWHHLHGVDTLVVCAGGHARCRELRGIHWREAVGTGGALGGALDARMFPICGCEDGVCVREGFVDGRGSREAFVCLSSGRRGADFHGGDRHSSSRW